MPNSPPMTTRMVSSPRMKSGRVRCSPLSTLSIISAWMSTPGTAVSSGVARKSWSALAVAPMSTMAPSSGFGSNSPARMRHAAMRRSGPSAGVADPDCPGPAGQRFDGADLDACHAAALAEIGVAACVRGTDHERRGTLCDAQRFRRQARDKLSGDVEDRRQLAHDEVPVGHEIHGAETGRRLAERSERQERAGEGRQEGTRIVAGEGEPGLDDRLRAVLGEGHAEHELAAPDRLRKHTVAFRF